MLIDFHTHLFPDNIAQRAMEALKNGIIKAQGRLLLEPQTDGTRAGLIRSMDKYGVDTSIVMPIATSPTQHTRINQFAKEITDEKRIISFGSVHPRQEDWEETLENVAETGLKGIKMHPEFQDFFIDEEITEKIVKKCQELGLWILFHCGEDYGYKPPFRCTPQRLRNLIDKTGGSNIIAAHFGSFRMWDDVERYLVGTDIYMDTSMASGLLEGDKGREMVLAHGAEKILFGSDNPWHNPSQALDFVHSMKLQKEMEELILYKNAQRILQLHY